MTATALTDWRHRLANARLIVDTVAPSDATPAQFDTVFATYGEACENEHLWNADTAVLDRWISSIVGAVLRGALPASVIASAPR